MALKAYLSRALANFPDRASSIGLARIAGILPWRRSGDPYRIWVAEIMLQQTRIAAVTPYFDRFLSRFPDVQSLAPPGGTKC